MIVTELTELKKQISSLQQQVSDLHTEDIEQDIAALRKEIAELKRDNQRLRDACFRLLDATVIVVSFATSIAKGDAGTVRKEWEEFKEIRSTIYDTLEGIGE